MHLFNSIIVWIDISYLSRLFAVEIELEVPIITLP